jgi:hypothetical protein
LTLVAAGKSAKETQKLRKRDDKRKGKTRES